MTERERRRRERAALRRLLRRRSFKALRNYLLAGILVTGPAVATVWLVWHVVRFVDSRVQPLIPERFNPSTYLPVGIPGLGLLVAVLVLVVVGFFATSYAGRALTGLSDSLLSRVPLIRGIYGWTKQVFETVLAQRSTAFRRVVLVEYPRPGIWAVGFVTGKTEGEVQDITAETVVNVFLPATPNVTTGFLLFVPERDVRPMDISVEEGLKLIISGGIVMPNETPAPALPQVDVSRRGRLAARLRRCLLAGLLVTGPIGITLWLVWALVAFVDRRVALLVPDSWQSVLDLPLVLPAIGIAVVLLALIVIGTFATGFVGRTLIRTGERVVARMPVIRNIYSAFKHFFETVLSRQSGSFRQVVLFEYPRPRCWAMGFVTGRSRRAASVLPGRPVSVHVFLPTTPNPTSGFLLLLPEDDVRVLNMTPEEGVKMVVSGGLVTPPARRRRPPEGPLRQVVG